MIDDEIVETTTHAAAARRQQRVFEQLPEAAAKGGCKAFWQPSNGVEGSVEGRKEGRKSGEESGEEDNELRTNGYSNTERIAQTMNEWSSDVAHRTRTRDALRSFETNASCDAIAVSDNLDHLFAALTATGLATTAEINTFGSRCTGSGWIVH